MSWFQETEIAIAGLTLGLLAAAALPAAAQREEPAAGFEDLVEVTEVLLDVLAVDREGQIVAGLGKDDFLIEEDGEPVELTSVSFYTTRYAQDDTTPVVVPATRRTAAEVIPSSRYFVFFFHDQTHGGSIANYLARRQSRARKDSLRWIEDHLLPSDWVAIVSYDVRLKVHQDFTQDRAALAAGMKSATSRRNPEQGLGRRGRILPPSGTPSLLRHLPEGKALRRQTRDPYGAIRLLAEAAGWIVGRKNMLLFSRGFGELTSGYLVTEPDRRKYAPMEHALNDHNVALYTIDLTPPEVEHFQGHFLNQLALDTGGLYFHHLSRFLPALRRASEENVGYYLVSYQSEHPAAEVGYQRVKVRSRDRGIRLRARKGYRYGAD